MEFGKGFKPIWHGILNNQYINSELGIKNSELDIISREDINFTSKHNKKFELAYKK